MIKNIATLNPKAAKNSAYLWLTQAIVSPAGIALILLIILIITKKFFVKILKIGAKNTRLRTALKNILKLRGKRFASTKKISAWEIPWPPAGLSKDNMMI